MVEFIFNITEFLIAIAGLSGVGGLFWGIFQYRQTRIEKRKDILFQLADKFDNDERLTYAKKILDDFNLKPQTGWQYNARDYHKRNLENILGSHFDQAVSDAGYRDIRDSFDALFDFFDRLAYLYKLKLIKDAELSHFEYFIKKGKDNPNVKKFVDTYEFKWIKELPLDFK